MDWDDMLGLFGIATLAAGVGFAERSWPAALIVVGGCFVVASAVALLSQLIAQARR